MTIDRSPHLADFSHHSDDRSPDLLGEAPHVADAAAAQRARQALKARLFPGSASLSPHIGRFTILRELGRGGMGIVYVAYDETLDRRVALKLLYDLPTGDPQAQTRLLREAQAMARLNHPNIAAVYEAGTHEGRVFVAMEFVQGQPLDAWLRERPRPWREIVDVFIQAARGLHAAHAIGLVHRDFKPANCMLGGDGRVRVLDFGLARGVRTLTTETSLGDASHTSVTMPMQGLRAATLTGDGTIVGTPAYMPPEQFRGQPIDARADQFALCVSLYEALHARLPYSGATLPELWAAVLNGPPRAPPRGPKVPAWLHRLVLRGLDPDPAHRFPTTADLLAALGRSPSRRYRTWLSFALVAGAVAGGVAGLDRWRNAQCEFAQDELAGVWDAERRAELRAGFERVGTTEAMSAWSAAERALDDATRQWLAAQTSACQSFQSGKESARSYERRMQCFTKHKAAILSAFDAVAQLEYRSVREVTAATRALATVPDCTNEHALGSGVDAPPSDKQGEIEQIYKEYYAIEKDSERDDTSPRALLQRNQALLDAATTLGYQPLIAELMRQRAFCERGVGLHAEACATIKDSFFKSESVGNDVGTMFDAKDILTICGSAGLGHAAESGLWARMTLAKIERNETTDVTVRVALLARLARGVLLSDPSDAGGEASASLERAFILVRENPDEFSRLAAGHVPMLVLFYVGALYLANTAEGGPEHAVRHAITATIDRVYQAEPLSVPFTWITEFEIRERIGDGRWGEALEVARRGLGILGERSPLDYESITRLSSQAAYVLMLTERCEKAVDMAEATMAARSRAQTLDAATQMNAVGGHIVIHSICGDLKVASASLTELREVVKQYALLNAGFLDGPAGVYETVSYGDLRSVGMLERSLEQSQLNARLDRASWVQDLQFYASASQKAGVRDKARTAAQQAISIVEESWGTEHIALAAPLTTLGRIELEAGNIDTAVAHLERALLLRTDSDAMFRGDTMFALARALSRRRGSANRARVLGEMALREYGKARHRREAERAEVEAWLATGSRSSPA